MSERLFQSEDDVIFIYFNLSVSHSYRRFDEFSAFLIYSSLGTHEHLFLIWFLYFKLVKLLNVRFFRVSLILTTICWLKEDCHSSEVTSRNNHQIKYSGASLMCLAFCWTCYSLVGINYLSVLKTLFRKTFVFHLNKYLHNK